MHAQPLPAEPERRLVEARWELRGDGLTVPYRWVWIPNPPSGPPSSMPPSSEPHRGTKLGMFDCTAKVRPGSGYH